MITNQATHQCPLSFLLAVLVQSPCAAATSLLPTTMSATKCQLSHPGLHPLAAILCPSHHTSVSARQQAVQHVTSPAWTQTG